MQVPLALCLLLPIVASLRAVFSGIRNSSRIGSSSDKITQEEKTKFIETFKRTNFSLLHEGMEELRHRVSDMLNTDLSEKDKAMIKEYNKHHHHPNYTHVNKEGDNIDEINVKKKFSKDFFQGDLILTPEQIAELTQSHNQSTRARRQAYKGDRYPFTLWEDNMVYYFFDNSITTKVRSDIEKAIGFWQRNTCITFKHLNRPGNSIRFFKGNGCFSNIGRIGRTQDISIGSNCDAVGIVMHELGHALGFFHMQSRHDRDRYILINEDNIKTSMIANFEKQSTATNYNYNLPFNFGSFMLYDGLSFSKNNKETIIAKNAKYQNTMGSLRGSFLDVLMMNLHYRCTAKCAGTTIKCENGGYPHPRNCSTCQCPGGFGGERCTKRRSGCGEVLKATSQFQKFEAHHGSLNDGLAQEFSDCNYLVVGPKGKRIQAKLVDLTTPSCDPGCVYGGVEIKGEIDMRPNGPRYCCLEERNTVIQSPHNVLVLIMYKRLKRIGLVLEYKYVDGGSVGPVLEEGSTSPTRSLPETPIPLRAKTTIAPKENGKCRNMSDATACQISI